MARRVINTPDADETGALNQRISLPQPGLAAGPSKGIDGDESDPNSAYPPPNTETGGASSMRVRKSMPGQSIDVGVWTEEYNPAAGREGAAAVEMYLTHDRGRDYEPTARNGKGQFYTQMEMDPNPDGIDSLWRGAYQICPNGDDDYQT